MLYDSSWLSCCSVWVYILSCSPLAQTQLLWTVKPTEELKGEKCVSEGVGRRTGETQHIISKGNMAHSSRLWNFSESYAAFCGWSLADTHLVSTMSSWSAVGCRVSVCDCNVCVCVIWSLNSSYPFHSPSEWHTQTQTQVKALVCDVLIRDGKSVRQWG